jgi:hypothetical protein
MSRFTDALVVSPLADGKTWVIVRDFGYDVGAEDSGDHIGVAIGFQTDFATIPRPFWIILPKWGRYGNATVIHDWLYWLQTRPRREADAILLEAMDVLGVTPLVKYAWNGDSNASADYRHYQDRTISTQPKPHLSIFHSPSHRHRDLGQQRVASRNIDPHACSNLVRGHREGGEVLGAKIRRCVSTI